MKTNSALPFLGQHQSSPDEFKNYINLNQLVTNLVNNSLPTACQKNTNIVNEVGHGIVLCSDMSHIASVIQELLLEVIANSQNGKIHISADRFKNIIILEIQERNNYNGYALSCRIGNIGPEAAVIGGHISITAPQKKVTTVTFSFPNQQQVA